MTNSNNAKTYTDENNDASGIFEARNNRPEGGYEISPQVTEWLSDDSIEVMQHFGLEAPDLLNKYSNALEDALIEQVRQVKALRAQLAEYQAADRGDISL